MDNLNANHTRLVSNCRYSKAINDDIRNTFKEYREEYHRHLLIQHQVINKESKIVEELLKRDGKLLRDNPWESMIKNIQKTEIEPPMDFLTPS
jgi:hypothetical protein